MRLVLLVDCQPRIPLLVYRFVHLFRIDCDGLRHIVRLVNADQFVGQLKHVVPQGNDDELAVVGAYVTRQCLVFVADAIFDVLSDNCHIFVVQGSIHLVHAVEGGWLVDMQRKNQ